LLRIKTSVFVLFRLEKSILSFAAASSTDFFISGATRLLLLRTRETVATLTPAAAAISRSPSLLFRGDVFFIGTHNLGSAQGCKYPGRDTAGLHANYTGKIYGKFSK
jgi:hypothetical protein